MIRLVSWNVNGIRANIKKGLWSSVEYIKPDVFGVQETKSDQSIMLSGIAESPVFDMVFHSCSMKKGYSGVATFYLKSNLKGDSIFENNHSPRNTLLELSGTVYGVGDEKFDIEGRLITTKYRILKPKYYIKEITIINGYYPQGGRDGRVPYKIEFYKKVYEYAKSLREKGEYVILCGDLNTTVADIDLARPKQNRKTTGCLPEERDALNWFLNDGFVDSFRHFYPEKENAYSYWDQITRARDRNVGWRIDYFLVDHKLLPYLKDAKIWSEIMGSDHCPVSIDLDL
jgi:exodeoxyribonuclease III